jgi:hypothetical protein
MARDLLHEALEKYEDLALARVADERDKALLGSAWLTHDEVSWGRRAKKILSRARIAKSPVQPEKSDAARFEPRRMQGVRATRSGLAVGWRGRAGTAGRT